MILIMAFMAAIQEYKDQKGEMVSIWYVVSAFAMLFSEYILPLFFK